MFRDDDMLFINNYYVEAVYARSITAMVSPGRSPTAEGGCVSWDTEFCPYSGHGAGLTLRFRDSIQDQMRTSPHVRGILKGADVEIEVRICKLSTDLGRRIMNIGGVHEGMGILA